MNAAINKGNIKSENFFFFFYKVERKVKTRNRTRIHEKYPPQKKKPVI
jgi:hypothetical protein